MPTGQPTPRTAHIALGANLGDRAGAIDAALRALDALPGVCVAARSTLHETPALVAPGAPPQPAYLNAAALLETTLPPRALLAALLEVERSLGRVRTEGARWEARTIDLDLLLYGSDMIDEPGLTLPHPRMHERRFVLAPLAEIAPDAVHPALGLSIAALLSRCADPAGTP